MFRLLLLAACISFTFASCLVVDTNYDKLPPGPYRGVLLLDGRQSQRLKPDDVAANFNLEEVARGELPFNFEVSYDTSQNLVFTFTNGEERVVVSDVEFVRPLQTARDTLTVHFPLNDSYLTAYHENGVIEGYFVDEARDNGKYRIPFAAFFGQDHRFTQVKQMPVTDLSGRWEVEFSVNDTADAYSAVAEFVQEGNALTGTFLTTTGDYRYLQGTVQADRAYLSVFDGAHAFLFSAKLQPDSSLLGIFRSGTHYQTIWEARRNLSATLPDATQETKVVNPDASIELSGLLPSGERLSLAELPGRYTVVSLFGSWCPNCKDEALYLDSLQSTFSPQDVSFVGAAFEQMRDTTRALAAVARFGKRLDISYPLMLVGSSDKEEATQQLGFLDRVRSFPTLLILDEQQRVVYTHTGFAGPATSEYGEFTKAFAKTLQTFHAQ